MIHLKTQYFSLNRILLLPIGLWPYQQSRLTRFQFILFSAILMASIIFQLTSFITLKCTSNLIATVLSSVSFYIILLIKYYTFGINIKVVKKLLIKLQHECNKLKDKNEIAIMEKYGYIAKCYTAGLTAAGICGTSAMIIIPFWSMFDIVLSTNVSQSSRMQFVTEYFADQEKYFFLILLHINTTICIGAATILGTGTMLIAYFKFICGMFKISSYRFERAREFNILQNITLKNKILRSEDLISAIDIHRQAMKLTKRMQSNFDLMFFWIGQIFVISLCFSLVRIFQIISSEEAATKAILPMTIIASDILYMFLANFVGQDITDHNNYVFATIYKVKWYITPLHIQRIILFLLLKGAKNFTLEAGLFIPSLECFATLVKSTVSYFTVVLSVQ